MIKYRDWTLKGNTDFFIKDLLEDEKGLSMGGMLALLKYPFYPLFILDNGMNLISKSLTVITPA